MNRVNTILVLNSGSSSVKASLLCPDPHSGTDESKQPSLLSPPVRLVSAHAEMLGSPGSSLTVNICTSAVSEITERMVQMQERHQAHTISEESKSQTKLCGLVLTSRASGREYDHPRPKKRGVLRPLVNQKTFTMKNMSHQWAIETIIERLVAMCGPQIMQTIAGIGHRVVHGGDKFVADATVVTESVLKTIESISHLAPL